MKGAIGVSCLFPLLFAVDLGVDHPSSASAQHLKYLMTTPSFSFNNAGESAVMGFEMSSLYLAKEDTASNDIDRAYNYNLGTSLHSVCLSKVLFLFFRIIMLLF